MPASSLILTKTAYARLRGVDQSTVAQWIKRGHLSGAAITEDGKIVVAEADRQLRERLDLSRSLSHGGSVSLLEAPAPVAAAPIAPAPAPSLPPSGDPVAEFNVRRARALADSAESDAVAKRRKNLLDTGVYILAEQVRRLRRKALAQMLAAFENWIADVAGEMGLTREQTMAMKESFRRFRDRQANDAEARAALEPELLPEPMLDAA